MSPFFLLSSVARCLDCITEMLELLKLNPDITINENVPEDSETVSVSQLKVSNLPNTSNHHSSV